MYSAQASSILLMMNNDEQSIQLRPAQPDHPFSFQARGGNKVLFRLPSTPGMNRSFLPDRLGHSTYATYVLCRLGQVSLGTGLWQRLVWSIMYGWLFWMADTED